jgi:hypothetical protein
MSDAVDDVKFGVGKQELNPPLRGHGSDVVLVASD